jgi:hypothetical protein
MSLTINLNAEAESRLKIAAKRRGIQPEVYARQIIEENLPEAQSAETSQATLDLLARWDAEDETTDSKEIDSRRAEVDEFKKSMNQNRLESEGPASRKIYP